MLNQLSAGAAFASAIASSSAVSTLVVWNNGNDTYVSVVTVDVGTGKATAGLTSFGSATGLAAVNIAIIEGVTPGALVAGNFTIV